jgi:hypothetical protein
VFPGKSFFSAHEVSTCKISGCLSYRILDSGPDGTQTTLTINTSLCYLSRLFPSEGIAPVIQMTQTYIREQPHEFNIPA